MENFLYVGLPTFDSTTKDIKIPKSDGTFDLFDNVQPNVTQITVSDPKSIEYCNKNPNFSKVS